MCKLIVSTVLLVLVMHFPGCPQPYFQGIKPLVLFHFPHWAVLLGLLIRYSSFSSFKFLLTCTEVLPSKTVLLHRQTDRTGRALMPQIIFSAAVYHLSSLTRSPVFFSHCQGTGLGYLSPLQQISTNSLGYFYCFA